MEYVRLPGLNRMVSRISAGCWTIGGTAVNGGKPVGWDNVDAEAAYSGLVLAYQSGVTLFDTADVYGMGSSERLVGRLLSGVPRNSVMVSSKGGYFAGTARHPYLPQQLGHQFAVTLDNLGTDYLDVYHLHSGDFGPSDEYLQATVMAVRRLRKLGMVRAIGMRAPHRFAVEWADDPDHPWGEEASRFLHLFRTVQPDVLTVRRNLMTPLYEPGETDVFAFARAESVGVLVKQTLGQGLLLGNYRAGQQRDFSAQDHRSRRSKDEALIRLMEKALEEIHGRFGKSRRDLARVAVQYAVHDAPEAVALVGFRDASQIADTLAGAGRPLTDDDITLVQNAMSSVREKMTEQRPNRLARQAD
ncbi:aldo/keto reductase [Streptomyces sp. NBC_00829]|uniref:aldo/keto reductase n=1 Tax=Streptomyces sp. NBC_00829 TaxID=2903679 RepID=UPI003864F101|nr:aldo/keto reductase [Streptomyces sp. NBC_00829]